MTFVSRHKASLPKHLATFPYFPEDLPLLEYYKASAFKTDGALVSNARADIPQITLSV